MFIKRLEIQGFKTFAERTELLLTDGITAIVGPNGSGKSNIADAVSWVLGEQNVRNLRGVRSQDIIFAGSDKRKPLGMAEVSITIDNSCGSLPVDFGEVTVTRRAYRSGDSEYFINKAACRLKDIYELFLDTGMGRDAYSMVSQGEIDAILSAKSEDRRSLFEEAAGIKKYRHRRKEASRKLENTETNLRRVNDIAAELSGQVEPLAEQAEIAARYDELVTRLREIETGQLINDLRRWSSELERIRDVKTNGASQLTEQDRRISDLEWEKEKYNGQLLDLDRSLDSARGKHQEVTATHQRIRSRLALIEERQRSAEDAKIRIDSEMEQLARKIGESEERLTRITLELEACTQQESTLVKEIAERTSSIEAANADFDSAARMAEDHKSAYLELAREQAAKRTELESLRSRLAELEVAMGKYDAELTSLEEARQLAVERLAGFFASAEEIFHRQKTRDAELPSTMEQGVRAQSRISAATEKLADINRQTVGKSSRHSTLKEMADAHEGFFEGVRAVMAARKANLLAGRYSTVADVITVPQGYETAIDVALGNAVQDIITDTVDDAKSAIRFLKEKRAGRATFLPLDGIRSQSTTIRGNLRQSGIRGIASELVSFDGRYAAAINVLLGRVLIVDDIDSAVQVSRKLAGWGRIVTLDGEVIVPTGAMTGGTRQNKGPNLLGRKQEMETLAKELAELEQVRSKVEAELDRARNDLSLASSKAEELENAAASDRMSLAEAERQIEFAQAECKRLEGQIEIVSSEKEEVELAVESDSRAFSALEVDLSAAGKENTDLDEYVQGAEKRMEELKSKRESLSAELMEMSIGLASVRERKTAYEQSIQQTTDSANEMRRELESRRSEIGRQAAESEANVREKSTLTEEAAACESLLAQAGKELEDLVAKRSQMAQATGNVDAELKQLHRTRTETAELVRECDVKEARLEVQVTQTSTRLFEEYDITTEEALAREEMVELERGTATEVARLRREIRAMGPVNTGAIQEYERIKERWEFLTAQKSDLEEARAKLQDAIRDIDESTKGLFMQTFNSVGGHFDRMFKELFGGGKTELILTDPSNLLETGVEVIVQPPGKKLQNMTLLSGGERALTASALLFALLLERPSPFVLFDEVDAPLDDTNVERFADVLREFSRNSQFIVVTHNRATMEASDTLYGVTMQEPGVSRLISVRLADSIERRRTGNEVVMVSD